MSESEKCPECGKGVGANAPRGLCPACLFKRVLEGNSGAPTEPGERAGWTPVMEDELAGKFPELEGIKLIGRGGMGAVYRARQKSLGRDVALKVLLSEVGKDEAFKARFEREAQAMARLNHPHIVAIYEYGVREGLYYFLMEYVDGLSLRGLLDSGHVSTREALAIVPEICDALQYAHGKGIVHRDIKPENILLNKAGRVKIADFGLAKLVGEPGAGLGVGGEDRVAGTPRYMAPEQAERPGEVDHRADIYAVGVVFYQMLTGELPAAGGVFEAPSRRVVIDVRLDEVVLRALEREPGRRYQNVGEIKTQVETIAMTLGQAEAEGAQSAQGKRRRVSLHALAGLAWILWFFVVMAIQMRLGDFTDGGPFTRVDVVDLNTGISATEWRVLMAFIGVVGLTAPLGATFLGVMAMRKIKRSEGRVIGMPAAVASALFFPLLVVNSLMAWAWLMGMAWGYDRAMRWLFGDFRTLMMEVVMIVMCGMLLATAVGVVDYWVTRGVWGKPRGRGFKWTFGLVFLMALGGLGMTGCFYASEKERPGGERTVTEQMVLESSYEMRKLSTAEVIRLTLSHMESHVGWSVLAERKLTKENGKQIMEGMLAWLKREETAMQRPMMMARIEGLLEKMHREELFTQEQELDVVEAVQGNLSRVKVRFREGKKDVRFELLDWRQVSNRQFFGLKVMNAVKGLEVDGQAVTEGKPMVTQWDSERCSGRVNLSGLKPGKHTVKVDVVTGVAAKADLAGLESNAPLEDWPAMTRQWTRQGEVEVMVYGPNDKIVKETVDRALDPVATKTLLLKSVFVRSKGKKMQVVAAFEGKASAVPVSFDVTVRIGGQDVRAGRVFRWTGGGSDMEVEGEITALDAGVTTADVVLTPNARWVDDVEKIDRIWGGVVEFKGVEVKRQDLGR